MIQALNMLPNPYRLPSLKSMGVLSLREEYFWLWDAKALVVR
jgi:hypothetical protein